MSRDGPGGQTWDDPEADPTGVRALLAALPDPGPMPAHVTVRIAEALHAEQARRAWTASPGSGPISPGPWDDGIPPHPVVVPLAPPVRRRHSRWITLGTVAAGFAAVAMAIGGAVQGRKNHAAEVAAVAGRAAQQSSATALSPPAAASPSVHIQRTGTTYRAATLPEQAMAAMQAPSDPVPEAVAGVGSLTTLAGVQSCLAGLGAADADRTLVDLARFEDQPAALVVVVRGGDRVGYAVSLTCSATDPGVLAGPVPVG